MSTKQPRTTIGASVTYVDEVGKRTPALVTAIHGVFHDEPVWTEAKVREVYAHVSGEQLDGVIERLVGTPTTLIPCINVVYVSTDESQKDPYGRQVARASSVQHQSATTAHGRFWY